MKISKDEVLKHCDDFLILSKEMKEEDIMYFKINDIEVSIERKFQTLEIENRLENLDNLISMLNNSDFDENEVLSRLSDMRVLFNSKIKHSGYVFDSYIKRKGKEYLDKKIDPALVLWWKIIEENYPTHQENHFDISFFDKDYNFDDYDTNKHINNIDITLSNNSIAILVKNKLIELTGEINGN